MARQTTVLLTGGHAATTALSTIEELRKQNSNLKLVWFGAKHATEGGAHTTLEHKLFNELDIDYYHINTGRLQRKFTSRTVVSLLKVPYGLIQSMFLLMKIKPDVVLSFGGFVAVPVVVAAWALRIPIIIHEQTIAIGLANKMSSRFANKIAISRLESDKYYPKGKTVLVGNPMHEHIIAVKPKSKISSKRLIYITGGSRGSQILNESVEKALPVLLKNYHVLHQTGDLDEQHFKDYKASLPKDLSSRYECIGTLKPHAAAKAFRDADVVVGRAGANTVSEIIYTKRPAVLVPIPWTRYDEQTKNALLAQSIGIAKVLPQNELSGEKLIGAIEYVFKNWKKMATSESKIEKLDSGAASKLASETLGLI